MLKRHRYVISSTPYADVGDSYDQALEALSNNHVKILTLSFYNQENLSDECFEELAEKLNENTSLRLLKFDRCTVVDNWVYRLFKDLDQSKTLTKIHFAGNATCINIADEGAEYIAAYLKITTSLASIIIEDSLIRDYGAVILAEALKVNKTICKFHIGGKDITIEGVYALWMALSSNDNIISLVTPPFSNENWYIKGHSILGKRLKMVDYSVCEYIQFKDQGTEIKDITILKKYCTAIKYILNEKDRVDLINSFDEVVNAQEI